MDSPKYEKLSHISLVTEFHLNTSQPSLFLLHRTDSHLVSVLFILLPKTITISYISTTPGIRIMRHPHILLFFFFFSFLSPILGAGVFPGAAAGSRSNSKSPATQNAQQKHEGSNKPSGPQGAQGPNGSGGSGGSSGGGSKNSPGFRNNKQTYRPEEEKETGGETPGQPAHGSSDQPPSHVPDVPKSSNDRERPKDDGPDDETSKERQGGASSTVEVAVSSRTGMTTPTTLSMVSSTTSSMMTSTTSTTGGSLSTPAPTLQSEGAAGMEPVELNLLGLLVAVGMGVLIVVSLVIFFLSVVSAKGPPGAGQVAAPKPAPQNQGVRKTPVVPEAPAPPGGAIAPPKGLVPPQGPYTKNQSKQTGGKNTDKTTKQNTNKNQAAKIEKERGELAQDNTSGNTKSDSTGSSSQDQSKPKEEEAKLPKTDNSTRDTTPKTASSADDSSTSTRATQTATTPSLSMTTSTTSSAASTGTLSLTPAAA
ncbi:MAG: hypothetical protein Q9209_003937 [Squamulea sp. 1 TL-2023]